MKRRVLAMLLVVTMMFSLFCPMSDVRAESNVVTNSEGDFYYASGSCSTQDYKAAYYYTDSYFAESSYNYQDSLATMSMCLSMASFRSNRTKNYSEKIQNLQALLSECGFTDFAANSDYRSQPTRESTGVACASKKVNVNNGTYTLIALTACGGGYEAEWGGSFKIGTSGPFENSRKGADVVLGFLRKYIADQEIKGDIKLWIAGYGLGAGKLNLVAGDLDDGVSLGNDVTLKKENMYAYCFECPKTALESCGLSSDVYKNIFCVNNPYDIFSKMAPADYGFGSFGVIKEFPTEHGDSQYVQKRDAMLNKLAMLEGTDAYIIDTFQMKKISLFGDGYVEDDTSKDWDQEEFVRNFITSLVASCAPTRTDYVNLLQDDLCNLLEIIFGTTDDNWSECMDIFVQNVQNNVRSVGMNIVLENESKLAGLFKEYACDALNKSGVESFSDSDVDTFANALARLAIEFGKEYPDDMVTLFCNTSQVFQAHSAPVNLAWLQSVDGNYNGIRRDITKCDVTLSKTSYNYNGKARKPAVTVKNGAVILTKGTDYTVTYSNNKNAGTAKVTIEGTGLYSGTIEKEFTINKISNTIKASNYSKTYSKDTRSFSIETEVKGNAKLTYKSNNSKITVNNKGTVTVKAKYIGKATITITSAATKNYKKTTKKITVTVKPKKTTLSSVVSKKSKTMTVKWKKNTSGSGYQICYSRTKDFSKNKKTVTIKKQSTVSATIKKLSGNKTYYVKIRAFKTVGDVKYYGAWSDVKSVKTKK
ncbi:MAG: fibronectin type III domain-containing protein [Lachnospiraceae bacterium]|nr:fibronectin type III domain-containing protein [Lachnospiraceae bacterium]